MFRTNQGRMPSHERGWFVDKELAGGGAVMDHTVHLADILRWFLHSEVVEVYAQTNHILHADKVDVETAVTGEDGYKALEITLVAYRSAAAGKPVFM